MTWLCDSAELIAGAWLSSAYAGHGILGDQVPSTGTDGAPPLYQALSLPADAAKEVRGLVTRWPTNGLLDIGEDGAFTYTGGSDYFDWRLYVDGPASNTDIGYGAGISRVTLDVGAGGTASFTGAVTLDAAQPGGGFNAGVASSFAGSVQLADAAPGGGFFSGQAPSVPSARVFVVRPSPALPEAWAGSTVLRPFHLIDPDSTLDFAFEWSPYLEIGDPLVSCTLLPVSVATITSVVWIGTQLSFWASGVPEGAEVEVTCRIVTAAGRVDDRTLVLQGVQR